MLSSSTPVGDLESPVPPISFSMKSTDARNAFTASKVLQELLQSEENYITSLRVMRAYYIEPYTLRLALELAAPMKMADSYLARMINNHTCLFYKLQGYMQSATSLDILAVSIALCVANMAIDVELYKAYCNIYEDVLKVMKPMVDISARGIEFSAQWMKGWETFLECTQPGSCHADLSFMSLIQQPVSRIAKYRLILEALLKCLCNKPRLEVENCLRDIKGQLEDINRGVENSEHKRKCQGINEYVFFEDISFSFKISLEFFGASVLVGGLYGIWSQGNSIEFMHCALLLYRSHLVLAHTKKDRRSGKHLPMFILPLQQCSIEANMEKKALNLVVNYALSTRLTFERLSCRHELILIFTSPQEQKVWQQNILALTSKTLPSPQHDSESLAIYPKSWQALKVANKPFASRSLDQHFPESLQVVNINSNYDTYPMPAQELGPEKSQALECKSLPDAICFYIKKCDRILVQEGLASIWSRELPLVSALKGRAPNLIRKSLSWSSVTQSSKRKLRRTRSLHAPLHCAQDLKKNLNLGECGENDVVEKDHQSNGGIFRNHSFKLRFRQAMRDFSTNHPAREV